MPMNDNAAELERATGAYEVDYKLQNTLAEYQAESPFAAKAKKLAKQAYIHFEKLPECQLKSGLRRIIDDSINIYPVELANSETPLIARDDVRLRNLIFFLCKDTPRPFGRLNWKNAVLYQFDQLLEDEFNTLLGEYSGNNPMESNYSYRLIMECQNETIKWLRRGLKNAELSTTILEQNTPSDEQARKINEQEKKIAESTGRMLEQTSKLSTLEQEMKKIKNELIICQRDLQTTKLELGRYKAQSPTRKNLSFFPSGNGSSTKISELFVCPLTQEVIVFPVVAADGMTYEESTIRQWIYDYKKDFSPMTRKKLANKILIPNQTIIDAKDKYLIKLIIICPLEGKLMEEPVIAADGYTYEREAIEAWFKNTSISPMTNKSVPSRTLIPNQAIKSVIGDYKSRFEVPSADVRPLAM